MAINVKPQKREGGLGGWARGGAERGGKELQEKRGCGLGKALRSISETV